MDFEEIDRWNKAKPGEYIYHSPTKQVVLCGEFDREKDRITALAGSRLFSDKIKNFKKIKLSEKERRERINPRRGCSSCGKR